MKKCNLCLELCELQDSHVIPNTVFRYIFRRNSGKGISLVVNDDSRIHYSSDSWSEDLLCLECEEHLNKEYENYSMGVLRNSISSVKFHRHSNGITFSNLDSLRFHLFFVSIIWRASISTHSAYSRIALSRLEPDLRGYLRSTKNCRPLLLGVKISRLVSNNPCLYTMEALKSFIISPFLKERKKGFSFCFLIEGFFIEMLVPHKYKDRKDKGVILPNKKVLHVPYLDVSSVPELSDILASLHRKHFIENKSDISIKANK